eukprot:TRINITY_DN5889_c0_g1_i5.p1 TRINITY_DN5889_c0_g1~~TRINITY_DN5889_c0_g1_i5.p1  ORF type:complete len:208 (-),score=73.80 TRINITY_DN5889_c0_g1_i5:291-914(-)
MIGYNAYTPSSSTDSSSNTLSTSFEAFKAQDADVIIIQQRAPVAQGKVDEFLAVVLDFARDNNVQQIILMTSVDISINITLAKLRGKQFRHVTSSSFDDKLVEASGVEPMEQEFLQDDYEAGHILGYHTVNRKIIDACQEADIPIMELISVTSEGDNLGEAVIMTNIVNSIVQILPLDQQTNQFQWVFPKAWDGLYSFEEAPKNIFF